MDKNEEDTNETFEPDEKIDKTDKTPDLFIQHPEVRARWDDIGTFITQNPQRVL